MLMRKAYEVHLPEGLRVPNECGAGSGQSLCTGTTVLAGVIDIE